MTYSISDDIFYYLFSADALPFQLMTVVVNNGVIAATNVGYNINYRQIACWIKKLFSRHMMLKKNWKMLNLCLIS